MITIDTLHNPALPDTHGIKPYPPTTESQISEAPSTTAYPRHLLAWRNEQRHLFRLDAGSTTNKLDRTIQTNRLRGHPLHQTKSSNSGPRYAVDEHPSHIMSALLGLQSVALIVSGIAITPIIVLKAADDMRLVS